MNKFERLQAALAESLVAPGPLRPGAGEFLDASAEQVPHLLDYWSIILKRRVTVLTALLIVFTTVAIGTLKQKPVYEGKVLIQIDPEEPNVLNFKEILQIEPLDVDSYRETQYNILESRSLAGHVVSDLKLYRNPEFYRKTSFLGLFQSEPEKMPDASGSAPVDTSSEVFRNSVIHFLDTVNVSPVRRSDLVEVSFYSHDAGLAARVANKLASDYIDQNLQVKWDETIKASEWLSNQLVGLKGRLENSEDALQRYAQSNSILFVEDKKNLVNARLEQLQQEYTKAQSDRFEKESLYTLVRSGRVQELPGFLSNRLIQDLAFRLADLQREYSQLSAYAKPDYPKSVQLKRQIDTIQAELDRAKQALSQNIADEYQTAVARERFLAQALDEQKKEVNQIAEKSIQYNILKREVETNRQLYEGLLQRLKEAQVSAGLKASNIRIVDPAEVPKQPVRPRVILNLTLGVVLGLALGIGLALFQEYLDNTIKNPDEVETLLRLPALGVLPMFSLNGTASSRKSNMVKITPRETQSNLSRVQADGHIVEAFRSLRTSILLSASPVPKAILIASALPSEGKTTATINLGATLASLGSRVLIADCDMRRPALHRFAGVKNSPGFVQCLTGQVELAEAILAVPGIPNLSAIPCGPIPPNPAEILSSPLAAELFRRLRSQFEYVLIDSPPLLSVADGRILSTLSDAVVLVTRADSTPYELVRRARALLYGAGARILGVALNAVDMQRDGYYYKYYYYRYKYGYGYGPPQGKSDNSSSNDNPSEF